MTTQSMNLSTKATSSKTTFEMQCMVGINIKQTPESIWKILTNADAFTSWNSTVVSIQGQISLNEKVKLKSYLDPKRTFNLKITTFEPAKKMVWEDGFAPMFKGVRTFTLEKRQDGTTDFTMTEVFRGLMLPMIAPSLPDFKPSFEKYALDLKTVAEKKS